MPNGFNEGQTSQIVAIDVRTLPGGPYDRYSGGRTLTHELGHYFGLLHTFGPGACTADGGADGILDTPAQELPTDGCETAPPKDSCPNQPGLDMISNFLDYSDDACMRSFTVGQVARMQAVILQYRPRLLAAALGDATPADPADPADPAPSLPPPRRVTPPPPRMPLPRPPPKRPPPKRAPPPKRPPPAAKTQTVVPGAGAKYKPPPPPIKRPPMPKRSPPPPKPGIALPSTPGGTQASVGR